MAGPAVFDTAMTAGGIVDPCIPPGALFDKTFASSPTPPPPPPPSPSESTFVPGGAPWADRDTDDTEFLAEVARLESPLLIDDGSDVEPSLVEYHASHLNVFVRATLLEVEVVERGNVIYFVATFAGDPDEVHFSYMRPGEQRPVVDPGFGQLRSKIARLGQGVYGFEIDTTDFRGGILQWHFWGTGQNQASQFGEIQIPERPAQLL